MPYAGVDIKEVWDFRLSRAAPVIVRGKEFWEIQIWAKDNPAYDPEKPETLAKPLEVISTDIKVEPGDEYDTAKVAACYELMYKVRDNYSLPDIEERKPLVAKINAANAALADLGAVE